MTPTLRLGAAPTLFALTLGLLGMRPAQADTRPRIAVLYFDNNTGDKALDVLQKGFADMMITDLSQLPEVVVVERDRLQALVKEIKLQRSRYFDRRTALKLGKGLGAQYAIAGSFASMKPEVRIDARLLDVARGSVLLGATVVGKETELFGLEQRLVQKIARQLRVAFRPARKGGQVPDLKTLLDYSKGIALADQGKLRAASLRIAAVAKLAPKFRLARLRSSELTRRLKQAGQRRALLLDSADLELERRAVAALKKPAVKGDREATKRRLMYHALAGWMALKRLRQHLSTGSPALLLPQKRRIALPLLDAHLKAQLRYLAALGRYAKAHTQRFPNGMRHLDSYLRLDAADASLATSTGLPTSASGDVVTLTIRTAEFVLLGRARIGNKSFTMAPPPGELRPAWRKRAYQMLTKVTKSEDAKGKAKLAGWRPSAAIEAREVYARALLLRGQRDAAVAQWQEVLDLYPTVHNYKYVETKIKKQLGLSHDHQRSQLERYEKGLKGCADMDLRVGIGGMMPLRLRLAGLPGLLATVVEVEKHCKTNPRARRLFSYLYSHAALSAGHHGACTLFEQLMVRFVAAGGSPRDVLGYRKNYTACPLPKAP